MEISINRGLVELKLLTKKINDKISQLKVATTVQSRSANQEACKKFVSDAEANLQSINDLIHRRNRIKSTIVLSNAMTKVTVANQEMTVAEAIERKSSIESEKRLCLKIREDYYQNKAAMEASNQNVENKADAQAKAIMGSDLEITDKGEQFKSIFNAYYETHCIELLAVDGLEETIERLQTSIDEFESEVDFVLSESNTKTMISILD